MSGRSPVDWIEEAAKTGIELRELIREGHELCRDMKGVLKEMQEARRVLPQEVQEMAGKRFEWAWKAKLAEYQNSLQETGVKAIHEVAKGMEEMLDAFIKDVREAANLDIEGHIEIVKRGHIERVKKEIN